MINDTRYLAPGFSDLPTAMQSITTRGLMRIYIIQIAHLRKFKRLRDRSIKSLRLIIFKTKSMNSELSAGNQEQLARPRVETRDPQLETLHLDSNQLNLEMLD